MASPARARNQASRPPLTVSMPTMCRGRTSTPRPVTVLGTLPRTLHATPVAISIPIARSGIQSLAVTALINWLSLSGDESVSRVPAGRAVYRDHPSVNPKEIKLPAGGAAKGRIARPREKHCLVPQCRFHRHNLPRPPASGLSRNPEGSPWSEGGRKETLPWRDKNARRKTRPWKAAPLIRISDAENRRWSDRLDGGGWRSRIHE